MTLDEIDLFRQARPEVPAYDPAAKARARALLTEAAETAPARRTPRRLAMPMRMTAAAALTVAATVGVAVVVNDAGPSPSRPSTGETRGVVLAPPSSKADLAREAARTAKTGPDERPRPDQWSYIKTVNASSSKGGGGYVFGPPDRRVTQERWIRADGQQAASMNKGRLQYDTRNTMIGAQPRHDYPYLLSLPPDADAILAGIKRELDESGWPAADRDARAFEVIEIYLRDVVLPVRVRAALVVALTKLRGVGYEARTADIAGRPGGVTFYQVVEGYLRVEIMIDPRTYAYRGYRAITIRDHRMDALDDTRKLKKGHIMGWSGVVASGIVDKAGQRP